MSIGLPTSAGGWGRCGWTPGDREPLSSNRSPRKKRTTIARERQRGGSERCACHAWNDDFLVLSGQPETRPLLILSYDLTQRRENNNSATTGNIDPCPGRRRSLCREAGDPIRRGGARCQAGGSRLGRHGAAGGSARGWRRYGACLR